MVESEVPKKDEEKKMEDYRKDYANILSTRRNIHSEIEEILIKKLFTMVEEIEVLPSGDLNFEPYTYHSLVQLETFLEKKFKDNVFSKESDNQTTAFLHKLKKELELREFND
ncbi:MAG: hypothetical protein U9O98_06305 [Asgard group archaeon]|nr:hypothetical protein [Asgard group archaeon]